MGDEIVLTREVHGVAAGTPATVCAAQFMPPFLCFVKCRFQGRKRGFLAARESFDITRRPPPFTTRNHSFSGKF
jgi:hypothetical protein